MIGLLRPGLEAGAVGLLTTAGLVLARRGEENQGGRTAPRPARGGPSLAHAAGAVAAGVLAWAATGWAVAGLWAAVGGWAAPGLLRRDRQRAAETERLDAWATWVGLIAGQLSGQASLAEALQAACRRAPGALGPDIAPLAEALAVLPLDEALATWAPPGAGSSELRQVGLVLSLAATGAGGHVSSVLGTLGAQLRARAASARRVERERRRTRLAGRAAAGVAGLWILAGARLDASLFGAYSSAGGQVLLAVLLGVVAAGLWGLARLDRNLA